MTLDATEYVVIIFDERARLFKQAFYLRVHILSIVASLYIGK